MFWRILVKPILLTPDCNSLIQVYNLLFYFSIDALLVTGSRTPHIQTVYNTHKNMNKKKTTLLVVDNVSDVMAEAVSTFSDNLL